MIGGGAFASGYQFREQSAVAQGVSQAGSAARGDDPSLRFFNPASQTWLRGSRSSRCCRASCTPAETRGATATRDTLVGGGPITGSPGGDVGADALVPGLRASTGLAPSRRLGIGVTSPWGLVTKYLADHVGRCQALNSSPRTIGVTPALSWQATPTLALGVSLQIQHASARRSSANDCGAVGALNPQLFAAGSWPGRCDGRSKTSGDETGLGWQLGAPWEARPGTRLGIGFRSAIAHTLSGNATFEGVPPPPNLSPQFRHTGGQARIATPETVTLGVTQRVGERLTLLAGAARANWSRFQQLNVTFADGRPASTTEERWKDIWFLSLGAEHRVTRTATLRQRRPCPGRPCPGRPSAEHRVTRTVTRKGTLRSGFAWDQSPVRTEFRTPRIPDRDRYWLSVGATWQALPAFTLADTLTLADTHVLADDARLALRDRGGPGTADLLRGNLDASIRASVTIVAVQARTTFRRAPTGRS